jgi:two-component system chemotaxis response regulator CheY
MAVIMTVDDSNSMRKLVAQTLALAGHEVIEATDGQHALDLIGARRIDAFVCDVNMPRIDGLTLVKRLRALPQYKYCPILMLTTEMDAEKKKIAKEAGATGWLVKPFQPDQLLATIKKVIS